MIIFIVAGRRQFFARDIQFDAVEAFGLVARCDALEGGDEITLGLARARHLKMPRAVLARQEAIVLHRQRIFGEGPKFYRAAHTMGGADPGDADVRGHSRLPTRYADFAAASACALRSLRGTAFSGLLRLSRFFTPAASRKRSTRSDGWAPLASQVFSLSMSSFSRSALSFGISGLKWPR